MENMVTYLTGGTVAASIVWFLWWKKQLKDELVMPEIALIDKDIERINARISKLEVKTDNLPQSIDQKINEINNEITEIKELLANLNGKLEIFLKEKA